MAKFNVTFVPSLNRQPEVVEADDVCAISDYTVQFVAENGHTTLVMGGVERVERAKREDSVKEFPELAVIDTTGKAANVPQEMFYRKEDGMGQVQSPESPITAT